MTTSKPISDLHAQHNSWLGKLAFYKDEIAIMRKQLEEVAGKNTSADVMASVEHFENQFLIQREQLDILKHRIKAHEAALGIAPLKGSVAADTRNDGDHNDLDEKMVRFENLFTALRLEQKEFASKWL
jgi:hypothetical protein